MKYVFLFFSALSLANSQTNQRNVDLGDEGNRRVRDALARYETKCDGNLPSPRILISGFGPFMGVSENISGKIVLEFARELGATILPTANGGWAYSSTWNERISLCFVHLDVIWDLAAGILLKEAEQFNPEFIFMTGRGGGSAIFEAGAINLATGAGGFDSHGKSLGSGNHPWCVRRFCDAWENTFVLSPEDRGVEKEVYFDWDSKALARVMEKVVKTTVLAPGSPRPENDYICNNVSYVVQHAAQGKMARLAGGLVELSLSRPTRSGFFHYPAHDTDDPSQWLTALKNVVPRLLN